MSSTQVFNHLPLSGKTAIITGASRGIGAHMAKEFARQGAHIAIVYHSDSSTEKAEDVASQVRSFGQRATVIKADLRDLDSGERIVTAARKDLNIDRIDILVNNAGSDAPPSAAVEFNPEVFDQ